MEREDVLWVHFEQVERVFADFPEQTGYGVLNEDRLAAAIARPRQSAGGTDAYPSLATKAAALAHSLILGHAFFDANKRTGILSGCVFMMVNGCELIAERNRLYQTALAVEAKTLSFDGLAEWYASPENILPLSEEEWELVQVEELEFRFRKIDPE